MKEGSHLNVNFLIITALSELHWIDILLKFMKEKSHLDVKVVEVFLKKAAWKYILLMFTKERSHSNVSCVNIVLLQKHTWKNILLQSMQKKRHLSVIFATKFFLVKLAWKAMLQKFTKKRRSVIKQQIGYYIEFLIIYDQYWDRKHIFMEIKHSKIILVVTSMRYKRKVSGLIPYLCK